jgi:hypothetical protein
MPRDQNNRHVRIGGPDFPDPVHSAAVGQFQVEQDGVEMFGIDFFLRRGQGRHRFHGESDIAQIA